MHVKIISILLTFFIFVIAGPARADDVKLMKDTRNHEPTMKADENRVAFQKSKELAKQPVKSPKKLKAGFQSAISRSVGAPILCANFLKTLEEMKKFPLTDSLHQVVYSYEFSLDPWKDRFWGSGIINETDSSNSTLSQPISKLYPYVDRFFEEGKIRSTLKLLQFRREEIFNEIFMGFRFSFGSKNTPMLVEMNISPFPEKGPGVIIAF